MSQQFYETDSGRGFVRGYSLWSTGLSGPSARLGRRRAGPLGRPAPRGDAPPVPPPVGDRDHGRGPARGDNRVELDPRSPTRTASRRRGSPTASARTASPCSARRRGPAGARKRRAPSRSFDTGNAASSRTSWAPPAWASDPQRSVVNRWNHAHDVENLFIVDGSSFTTSAAVNPTCTIGALALRAADGIWERRRGLGVNVQRATEPLTLPDHRRPARGAARCAPCSSRAPRSPPRPRAPRPPLRW